MHLSKVLALLSILSASNAMPFKAHMEETLPAPRQVKPEKRDDGKSVGLAALVASSNSLDYVKPPGKRAAGGPVGDAALIASSNSLDYVQPQTIAADTSMDLVESVDH